MPAKTWRGWLLLAVAAIIFVADQLSKEWIIANVEMYTSWAPIPAIAGWFTFTHVTNTGAAFGLFQDQAILFVLIAVVVAVAIVVYSRYLPAEQRLVRLALGMQLGGALGNLVDRLRHGYVTDFIDVGIPGGYRWPTFNIADSAIVVGVILLAIVILFDKEGAQERPAAPEPVADNTERA